MKTTTTVDTYLDSILAECGGDYAAAYGSLRGVLKVSVIMGGDIVLDEMYDKAVVLVHASKLEGEEA